MSKAAIEKNHMWFNKNIEKLIEYGLDIITNDSVNKAVSRSKEEKQMLLEALLLRSCAYWESFIENEVIYRINLDTSNFKVAMRVPDNTRLNLTLIKAILNSDSYRDFSNLERSRGAFKRFIVEKYNFSPEIDNEKLDKIGFVYKIRNYLSHYSEYSKNQLKLAYQDKHGYRIFQEPGVFLMKSEGKHFESLIHNFIMVSTLIKKQL